MVTRLDLHAQPVPLLTGMIATGTVVRAMIIDVGGIEVIGVIGVGLHVHPCPTLPVTDMIAESSQPIL